MMNCVFDIFICVLTGHIQKFIIFRFNVTLKFSSGDMQSFKRKTEDINLPLKLRVDNGIIKLMCSIIPKEC